MDWLGLGLGAVAVILVLAPRRFDPAIRLKAWFEGLDHS